MKAIQNTCATLSILAYFCALLYPCFCTHPYACDNHTGIELLLLGGFAIFIHPVGMVWLANPLLWMAWLSFGVPKRRFILSILACIMACLFMAFDTLPNYGWCGSFLEPEPCPDQTIHGLGPGYYFWLASPILLSLTYIFPLLNQLYDAYYTRQA